MLEFAFEDGEPVDINQLKAGFMPQKDYEKTHSGSVLSCHDAFIEYQNGVLLVKRNKYPAKDTLWPLGGKVYRGMKTEDSLRRKISEESNLELENIMLLDFARTFFKTNPFGLGHGTDSSNLVFYAKGKGELKLDKDHREPVIVTPDMMTPEFARNLHPYIRHFTEMVMDYIER